MCDIISFRNQIMEPQNKKEFSVEIIIEELDYFMVNCKLTSN